MTTSDLQSVHKDSVISSKPLGRGWLVGVVHPRAVASSRGVKSSPASLWLLSHGHGRTMHRMTDEQRVARVAQLRELRHSDPRAVISLYRVAAGLITTMPAGVTFKDMIAAIVAKEEEANSL